MTSDKPHVRKNNIVYTDTIKRNVLYSQHIQHVLCEKDMALGKLEREGGCGGGGASRGLMNSETGTSVFSLPVCS